MACFSLPIIRSGHENSLHRCSCLLFSLGLLSGLNQVVVLGRSAALRSPKGGAEAEAKGSAPAGRAGGRLPKFPSGQPPRQGWSGSGLCFLSVVALGASLTLAFSSCLTATGRAAISSHLSFCPR